MFKAVCIVFSIIVLVCVCSTTRQSGQLRFVAVLYRHGDRTPTKTYPKDPYKNISRYWPDGLGELTNLGIQHQYELGKWYRIRYDNFLPAKFSANDIYVRSTDRDRTLMSAAANLAGLYPPKDPQIWNKDLLWRPIPIHTVPNEEDAVLAMKKECPKYDLLYNKLLNSSFFQYINKKYEYLYKFLSKNTGWNVTQIRQIETIHSILSIEKQYNLTLPGWVNDTLLSKLEFLTAISLGSLSFTNELARLKNGPFFNYLFNYFDNVINNSTALKLLMLSAHDGTIANILSAMKVYDYNRPDFASSIIWELEQVEDDYYVNVYYKNRGNVSQLNLNGCEINCSYEAFKDLLEFVTVDDKNWSKECSE